MYKALLPYIKIARIDHWFKNVFMLPGVLVAMYLDHNLIGAHLIWPLLLGLLVAGLVASSNYVINEILDAKFDKLHPVKKHRPVPSGQVNLTWGYILWIVLAIVGLSLATLLGKPFFYSALALWVMGCFYNISPIRTKDKPYIDVLSESVNNPLRLLMGWYLTGATLIPPLSLILAYWMIGAFFMALKRYAEYKRIGDKETAANYRASFRHYNSERLMISVVYYVAAFGLFFGIFLIRYRIEFIVAIPFIAGFIAWYMHLAFLEDSPVQYPEKLYKERGFVLYALLCAAVMVGLLLVDMPVLHDLFSMTNSITAQ
ncbi:MAG: UbiA prenyltransferase family protein [Arenicellales bacterium]